MRRLLPRTIHDVALMLGREREGREASPSAAVVDRQSVKAPAAGKHGFDAARKIAGRKRDIAVGTDGRLLTANFTTADVSDSTGAQAIVAAARTRWPWLRHVLADGAYERTKLMDAAAYRDFILEIVCRPDCEPGFKVLPRRWVVERTFGWMTGWRRLVRDYEQRIDVSEAVIHVAVGSLLARRIVHPYHPQTDSETCQCPPDLLQNRPIFVGSHGAFLKCSQSIEAMAMGHEEINHYDLLIVDDILPSDFSPFRTLEYKHYLEFFNSKLFSMENWNGWVENNSFDDCLDRFPVPAELKKRIVRLDDIENVTGRLGYVTFLTNAFRLVDYFEIRSIPFIMQLYPGGGFDLEQPSTDQRLKRVLSSPMLRRVISTQKITRKYIVEKIGYDPNKVTDIYGGVFNSNVDFDFFKNKKMFPTHKSTIDICFVAHRYLNDFSAKGFDHFVAIAKEIAVLFEHVNFHVVGDYTSEDIDLEVAVGRVTFYGKQGSDFFSDFYPKMDAIVSVNRPSSSAAGAFDGFPTGACLEAGFRGVLNCINDPLDLNIYFTHQENVILLDYDVSRSISIISDLIRDPARLYDMSYQGWRLFQQKFNLDQQLWARTKLISDELNKDPGIVICPRISWNVLQNYGTTNHNASSEILHLQNTLSEQVKITEDTRDQLSAAAEYINTKNIYIDTLQETISKQVKVTENVHSQLVAAADYIDVKDDYIATLQKALSKQIKTTEDIHGQLIAAESYIKTKDDYIATLQTSLSKQIKVTEDIHSQLAVAAEYINKNDNYLNTLQETLSKQVDSTEEIYKKLMIAAEYINIKDSYIGKLHKDIEVLISANKNDHPKNEESIEVDDFDGKGS